MLALAIAAGATGCSSQNPKQAKLDVEKLKKEQPKPPFEPLVVLTEPNERATFDPKAKKKDDKEKSPDEKEAAASAEKQQDTDDEDADSRVVPRGFIKPGHWTGALISTTANGADFVGELTSTAQSVAQQPLDLTHSAYRLTTSRPAALPKAQPKTLETIFFTPTSAGTEWRGSTQMVNQLRDRRRGTVEWNGGAEPVRHMPSYQYYVCVLARDAGRYRYWKVLDSVRPPLAMPLIVADDQDYYRVLTPRAEAPLALPPRSLAWTSTAYVVWDDVLPAVLSPLQQQALLDWLHWGGGLIISGPRTLDQMRGTFLEPYLPAVAAETAEIGEVSLAELNAHWTLPNALGASVPLVPTEPWTGIKLQKHPAAEFVPGTGELVVERRVGRGRIVATAFRLTERELLAWRSYDSFVNGCLLGRPRRRFNTERREFNFVRSTGKAASDFSDKFDPQLITAVRYFTRDTEEPKDEPTSRSAFQQELVAAGADPNALASLQDSYSFAEQDRLESLKGAAGAAGWNDFSAAAGAAREALREAAGIAVPNRRFVLWMVGLYLVIVVPLNWLVFRAVGRVELAWLAVPVLAIGWGIVVIWLAQLDIGFARAETEVAVLEAQNGYSRGHLTRYMALYSSLSTTYDVHFDDPTALALPLALDETVVVGEGRSNVTLETAADAELDAFMVSSNSTGMVHSEQMISLNGTFDWREPTDGVPSIENSSRLALRGVAIVRRKETDAEAADSKRATTVEAVWIGRLPPGSKAEVAFKPLGDVRAEIAAGREQSPVTAKQRADGTLSLRRLCELAGDPRLLEAGDVRLVGWYDRELPGVHADPAAAQARHATLVIVNLRFGGRIPAPDENLRTVEKPIEF